MDGFVSVILQELSSDQHLDPFSFALNYDINRPKNDKYVLALKQSLSCLCSCHTSYDM